MYFVITIRCLFNNISIPKIQNLVKNATCFRFKVHTDGKCFFLKKEICQLPGIVLTWLTFSSISDMATFFFLSGLSFQYIDMAALLTACSNLLSEDILLTSCPFSGVIPTNRTIYQLPLQQFFRLY